MEIFRNMMYILVTSAIVENVVLAQLVSYLNPKTKK